MGISVEIKKAIASIYRKKVTCNPSEGILSVILTFKMKFLGEFMDIALKLLENLFSIYNESAFYLVLGLIFAGLSHRYLAADFIKKHLSGSSIWTNIKSVNRWYTSVLCSCGVVPVGLELKKKGLSKSATASF